MYQLSERAPCYSTQFLLWHGMAVGFLPGAGAGAGAEAPPSAVAPASDIANPALRYKRQEG